MSLSSFSENTSLKEFDKEVHESMKRIIEHFEKELNKLRTNRANPSLIEDIKITLSGNQQNILKKIALITTPESNSLLIKPFDITILSEIEKALSQSDFGFNPKNDGNSIKIILPQISKERRTELIKLVSKKMEEAVVNGRKIRQDVLNEIKKTEKNKDISQDFSQKLQKTLQNAFDQFTQQITQISKKKEVTLMQE